MSTTQKPTSYPCTVHFWCTNWDGETVTVKSDEEFENSLSQQDAVYLAWASSQPVPESRYEMGWTIIHPKRIVLLNTSILTTDGTFKLETTSLAHCKDMVRDSTGNPGNVAPDPNAAGVADQNHNYPEMISAIGHQSTADILTELFGVPVPVNRIEYVQQPGDIAIVFKMRGRPAEGKIMTREEIEEIGYDFKILTMI